MNMTCKADIPSYFLLCGYTPFDRDSQYDEMQAICNGDYKFEPVRKRPSDDGKALNIAGRVLAGRFGNRPRIRPSLPHD
jgi:hypothetical protein